MSKTAFIIIRTTSNFLVLGALVFLVFSIGPTVREEALYYFRRWRGTTFSLSAPEPVGGEDIPSPFAQFLTQKTPIKVTPVSTDFSIVIEKLGVNAPVVADVNPAESDEYFEALNHGVAHAAGTVSPGEVGNTYLFAHSALDFWNFGKYAMVFTLLRKLEVGDRIVLFHRGERFDYQVIGKEVVRGFDLRPLLREYDRPVLTLQTCDPPGTSLNRLIVTAELVL